MKQLAAEGRTVLVSSHLMSEMSVTADHLIVIGAGRLIADCSVQEFIERSSERSVLVRSPDAARLAGLITAAGGQLPDGMGHDGVLSVTGLAAPQIGELAAQAGLVLHELTPRLASLEEAFLERTSQSVEYQATAAPLTAVGEGAGR